MAHGGDHLATEGLIALGNLRASLLASAHLLAESCAREIDDARDQAERQVMGSAPFPIVQGSDAESIARELADLCEVGDALVAACRRQEGPEHEPLAIATRRLAADLWIAHAVLDKLPPVRRGRTSSRPPDPSRRAAG